MKPETLGWDPAIFVLTSPMFDPEAYSSLKTTDL